jgi:two-component system sensor histidine kinase YesM
MNFRGGKKLKAMTYRYLTKNMLMFLTPLLIPVLILGTFSIFITKSYNEKEIDKNNMTILSQTQTNLELILNEIDSLNLMFSTNPEIVVSLKEISKKSTMSYEDLEFLKTIRSFIETPAYAKPYIHSIYVYFENKQQQFITTTKTGFEQLQHFNDTSWYDSFMSHKKANAWTELRQVKMYDFEDKPTELLTLYRSLAPVDTSQKVGVIVLNINLKFLEKLLNELQTSSQQAILVVDDQGNIIIRNNNSYTLTDNDVKKFITAGNESFFKVKTADDTFVVSQLKSSRYNWRYISVIPQRLLYKAPNEIQALTALILLTSFLLGLFVTFYLHKKNDRRIQDIIAIINSANEDAPLPALQSSVKDEFGFIINNILQKFIEQKYLNLQLHERKYKQQVAELLALQSQINPHFLFNTLQTIYWKVQEFTGSPNEANKMLENLSDVIKYSLEDPYSPTTIGDEICHAKSYIEIQKVRYKDKFHVLWEYDEGVERCKALKLLLQPLIENAIYHGIKEKAGTNHIKIKIYHRHPYLHISVIDNGIGIPPHKLKQIKEDLQHSEHISSHIGLMNTNRRVKLIYGEQHGIKVLSKYAHGTAVHIHIPVEQNMYSGLRNVAGN